MGGKSIFIKIITIIICFALSGCTGKAVKKEDYSGYLKDYSQLQTAVDTEGEKVLRYVSPKLLAGEYKKIIFEPVQYYPEPQPTEEVSAQTLKDIRLYIDQKLREEISKKMEVVNNPGPGTLRLRIALTSIGKDTEGLKPYQFIPVALVLTGAKAAAGYHPHSAKLYLEAETQDSVTGERLAIAVRAGKGERLAKIAGAGHTVQLESIKPILDDWIAAYSNFLFGTL